MKEWRDKQNQKGFTLAEMLIVVAIIAVLVSISVPVFTDKLEKAREASDIANMRSAKAAAIMDYLDGTIVLDDNKEAGPYYYNVSEGVLKEDIEDDLPAYGQGTDSIDGGMRFDDYNETGGDGKVIGTDAKGKVIKVMITATEGDSDLDAGILVEMSWVDE